MKLKHGLRSALGVLALTTSVSGEEVWVPPSHLVPPTLNLLWPTTQGGFVAFGFAVPDDMEEFASAAVVLLPAASVVDEYDVYAEVKRNGEQVSVGDLAISMNNSLTLVANELQDVDISAVLAGLFDGTSAGNDYVNVFFWFPTGGPAANIGRVLGMRFAYKSLDGTDGLSCWDLNGNQVCDNATEDRNGDSLCTALDCQGPQGLPGRNGSDGDDGADGISCWDLNGNFACDRSTEDKNGDRLCTVLDCQGPPGPSVSTIAVCRIEGSVTCGGLCPGASQIIAQAFGPCTVTSETGSCSAIVPPFPGTPGTCCVCKP